MLFSSKPEGNFTKERALIKRLIRWLSKTATRAGEPQSNSAKKFLGRDFLRYWLEQLIILSMTASLIEKQINPYLARRLQKISFPPRCR